MKSLYAFLALVCAGALPACTVNYYGVDPNGHHTGPPRAGTVREYHSTDSVYVGGSTTTVITQPGTVGGPRGGYASTGPGRTNQQPPVRGGNGQPGGPRTSPNNYPPPRTNGGVRTPPVAGTPGGTSPQPGSSLPIGGTLPTGGTGQTAPSYPTGGIKPIPPTATPLPTASLPTTGSEGAGPGTHTGGIRTGGIKPAHPTEPPVTTGSQPAVEYPTGGIKPIPTPNVPATGTLPVGGEAGGAGGIRTGGIKPAHATELPATGDEQPADYPTGGIKPIPTSSLPGTAGTTRSETAGTIHRTGGYKPMRGSQAAETGSVPGGAGSPLPVSGEVAPGSTLASSPASNGSAGSVPVLSANNQVTPALVYAKMPCRGTCPSYTATIWPDGRVVYVGQQNVPRIGTFELKLAPATVASIQQQAQSVHFNELPASFASGTTDIPATVLTMYGAQGSSKTVTVEDSAPDEVQALFDYINGTVTQLVAKTGFNEEKLAPRRGR